ncbi:MAG: hypothetical protein OHK93_008316 [Ramalina farinacea]|uniref:Pentatricopeptide repeat domain-containing protein n=1 Tax=Ramalina farinacea TaxID=258253 RepID=A0AA43QNY2_9LECA|nr:hypothetical protein [Ramalina farinacea]
MQLAIRRLRLSYYASHCILNTRARALIKPYTTCSDEVAGGSAEQRDGNTIFAASAACPKPADDVAASEICIPHATGLRFPPGTKATVSEKRQDDKHTQLCARQSLENEQAPHHAEASGPIVSNPTNDAQIWLEILRSQQRHNGSQGVQETFKRMVESGFDIPSTSQTANEIWTRILQAGLRNDAFLEDVLEYAARQQAKTGSYPELYRSIIGSKLRTDPPNATWWHDKLRKTFPPCLEDYKLLLAQAIESDGLKVFEKIFAKHQVHPMYDIIVPQLCLAQMHVTAFRWHFLLLESQDLPSKFASLEPLLVHYSKMMNDKKIEALIRSTLASAHTLEAPLNKFARSQSQLPISQEILNRQLGAVHGIGPKTFSDTLCARFFATKLFRVETVINGLQMMATERIGPDSLREIVARDDCDCASICRHIDLLRKAGISIDSSKYSMLVQQAAMGNSKKLLRSLLESDVHPAAYEDLNVLEELYAMHYYRKERAQAQMVLAAMTAEVPDAPLQTHSINIRLRCSLRLQTSRQVTSLLEKMKRDSIPLTPKSSRHFRVLLLQKRRNHRLGRPSVTLQNIHLVTAVMRQTLESGGEVPIIAWREILRRLGMFGLLKEFRSLALWIVEHYSNRAPSAYLLSPVDSSRPAKDSMRGVSSRRTRPLTTTRALDATGVPSGQNAFERLGTTTQLNQLFTKQAQLAIVAWGFQQGAKQIVKSNRHAGRRENRMQWTWGLLLLQELRAGGVQVQKDLIAKACKQRLGQLFGSRISSKRLNRLARSMNNQRISSGDVQAQYGAYVQRMEDIWGKDLFLGGAQNLGVGGKSRQMHGSSDGKWQVENLQGETPENASTG